MPVVKQIVRLLLCIALTACTPSFTEQNGKKLAGQARLTDSIDIQRGNQRLLSRQAQLCLFSDATDTEAGLTVLRTMQTALGGYFVAVGVENEPMDYLRALASTTCPGAAYLFYVQPVGQASCKVSADTCSGIGYAQFVITIINAGDRSLLDRIKLSIKAGVFPSAKNDQERLEKSFEQLAIQLTGASG